MVFLVFPEDNYNCSTITPAKELVTNFNACNAQIDAMKPGSTSAHRRASRHYIPHTGGTEKGWGPTYGPVSKDKLSDVFK